MVLFHDAQKLAQEELDAIVGPDRMPTMDDFMKLPYVRATVKETLRCKQTVCDLPAFAYLFDRVPNWYQWCHAARLSQR